MNRPRYAALVATTLALLVAAPANAFNVLDNPGFETDAVLGQDPLPSFVSGWMGFQTFNATSAPNFPVRTGIGSLELVGNGGFGVPGAFQTFPAKPGQLWDLQGYMLSPTALPAGATFGLLKIVFGDGTSDLQLGTGAVTIGQADAPAFPGIMSLPLLNNTSAANTWQFTHAQGYAPAGTTEVRLYALFVDEMAATAYVDDVQASRAGDFDGDFDVDHDDLVIWEGAVGQTAAGDADGDHDTDGQDFLLWQRQLDGATMVTSAVPEPGSALLLAAGLAMAVRRGRKTAV